MLVKDYMQKTVVSVSPDDSIQSAVRLIFNLNFAGVPVTKNKKLIGMITEEDILRRLFPSVKEYMEDPIHSRDFEEMENNLMRLLTKPISSIMAKDIRTVKPTTPLMKAQSTMLLNGFSRLPVCSKKKTLVGIISQGDIFRALAGSDVPYDDNETYDAWLAHHYDLVQPWEHRLDAEIPSLDRLFKKYDIKTVVDIFCGTGEHDIALAKAGYNTTGLNKFKRMHEKTLGKYKKQPQYIKNLLEFRPGDYVKVLSGHPREYDSGIIMGNAITHHPDDYKEILTALSEALVEKNAVLVMQISNFHKILHYSNCLKRFVVSQSKEIAEGRYAFVEFYDPPDERGNLTLNMNILAKRSSRWVHAAINGTPIVYMTKQNTRPLIKKLGFKSIEFYGSLFNEPLFKEKFDPKKHDWLNVVATR